MRWQRLAVTPAQWDRALALYGAHFERADIGEWPAFVERGAGARPDQGFIVEQPERHRPPPMALTWTVDDAERLLCGRQWLVARDIELYVLGDDVMITGYDALGVHWTLDWPGAATRVDAQRRLIAELEGSIYRHRYRGWSTLPSMGTAAWSDDWPHEKLVEKWGLPDAEHHSIMCPRQSDWLHTLPDTTRALVTAIEGGTTDLEVDPGDARRVLRALGLDWPPWQTGGLPPMLAAANQDRGPCSVMRQDDAGNTFVVSTGHSEVMARRWVEVFEARGHKQIYWIEGPTGGGAQPPED